MFKTLFIAGPPFDVSLWDQVSTRMEKHGYLCESVPLLVDGNGSIHEEAERVAHHIKESTNPTILVAQGSALPVAVSASAISKPTGIVITNGALGRTDPLTRAMCAAAHLPHLMFNQMFSPDIVLRWLRSSAGLRRAVVNPYVMDHDTTVAICGPIFEDKMKRKRLQRYLQNLSEEAAKTPRLTSKTLICWGDSDPINPVLKSPLTDSNDALLTRDIVPGGKYLHPVERPWEIADRIDAWASKHLTTT
ncbi:MAG: hypothetical protein CL930_09285 [Deltaproteobacteria bacterium]|nr:hypothetical protein [Deltaproteobacteria bacterium]